VLNKFKASEISVLVATDVAARGLDVKDISHVINFSTPQSYEDYVHRIGRAGRAGNIGYAYTFVEL
jgi:ATP-dependent RNA helicase DeaD